MHINHYYKVGISGHRDLLPSNMEVYHAKLKNYLLNLKQRFSDNELLILTSLAEGADRLIAKVALELNIAYHVILPMPEVLYVEDFTTEGQVEFRYFLRQAKAQHTIALYAENTYELVSNPSIYRNLQYRHGGRSIVDMSDEMIIMTNGLENNKIGGTHDIENYAKEGEKIIFTIDCDRLSG